jgi:vacuolar iron transporter family protein
MEETVVELTPAQRHQSLANLRLERDAVVLYEQLATIERDPRRAEAFARIAANERRHAEIWARRLERAGQPVPPATGPRARVRLIILLARLLGTHAVADLVRALEGDEESEYAGQMTPETAAIAADEREHARIWQDLADGRAPTPDGSALPGDVDAADGRAATADSQASTADAVSAGDRAQMKRSSAHYSRGGIAEEAWHRGGRSGTLRAAVFGANDGLVSNLSLVMGVAGAMTGDAVVVLAGIAGLLAGAFSMAAGEYISMQSQRELFERQIAIEREEMRIMPDEEERELAGIFRGKGVSAEDAQRIAGALMKDPEQALDTKVREELGLDPDELGSPFGAAWSSFLSFAIGALVPLLPFLLATGSVALVGSLVLSLVALFLVGAGVSLVTGRGVWFSGLRQVAIGAVAAAVTFGVGTLIGVNIGG